MSSVPLNLKPRANSFSLEVNRAHKTVARTLFHDDYNANNAVEFEANYKGLNNSVQYKSVADVKVKPEGTAVAINDEARLDFRLQDDAILRLKLKHNNILAHVDTGFYGLSTRIGSTDINAWFNPYVQWQVAKAQGGKLSATSNALFFGANTHINNGTVVNSMRLKLDNKAPGLTGEFENNWKVRYNGALLNWYYIDDLQNLTKRVGRKLTAEYAVDAFTVAAELDKVKRGEVFDFNMDTLNLGVTYRHSGDLAYGLWSHTDLNKNNATTVAAGLNYRVNSDISVKAKADTNQDVTLFANYAIARGLNFQTSLQSSANAQRIRDVFNNAFKFGLKLKYDS